MEVHHHVHDPAVPHHKKNWKSYFWEFLMLFLAVFCGFLAEYQLEHVIENKREKVYINSLVTDLKYDTSQFTRFISLFQTKLPLFDSVFIFLNNPAAFDNKLPYRFWCRTDLAGVYIPAEPTIQQLTNSGNLRLLKNKRVLDSLLIYDSHINGAYLIQANYVVDFHKRLLQFKKKVFDQAGFSRYLDNLNTNSIDSTADYSLILLTKDKAEMIELINSYIEVKATDIFYIEQLKSRRKEAENLLKFIQKEYHL